MIGHPRLLSLSTAVPPHIVRQEDAEQFARHLFSDVIGSDPRLALVFGHAEIEKRHTCVPIEWFGQDHDFAEKNSLYMEHAISLGADVARQALAEAKLQPESVDHLVFVSSTGIADRKNSLVRPMASEPSWSSTVTQSSEQIGHVTPPMAPVASM